MNNITESEVEIFKTDNFVLFEQICDALENSNIKYINITNKSSKGIINYNNFFGKIIVLKETEKAALKVIQDILEFNKAPMDYEELPEELKESDSIESDN